MIFLFEQLIPGRTQQNQQRFQKQQIEQDYEDFGSDEDLETDEDYGVEQYDQPMDPTASPEFVPIKKYYLIQKLSALQNQLKLYNISEPDLDLIMKFADNLSYQSLVILCNKFIDYLSQKIQNTSAQ